MGYRATPQGKELSPEITIMSEANKNSIGTWESHNVPEKVWVATMAVAYKPEEGKAIQMALWQSDKSIVVMKSRNRDGEKRNLGALTTK
jgi:hypothetical protein